MPGQDQFGVNENGVAYLAAALLLVGAVLWSALSPRVEQTDFSMTYVGATLVHLGRSARLYDLQEQAAERQKTFKDPIPLLFEHPPFEALVLSPLARLPYRTAYVIWGLVNAGIWLALPLLLRPYAPLPRDPLGYLGLWIVFAPLGVALFQGQSSLVLLLFYSLCFIQWKRGRALAAGLFLGLGLLKFQFVLPFAVIFLLRRQWRFLAGFSLSAAFLGALSLIAVGWRGVLSYARFLATVAGDPHNASFGNAIVMGTLQGFFNAVLYRYLSVRAIGVLVAVVSLSLIGFTARHWDRVTSRGTDIKRHLETCAASDDLMFAAALAVSLATGLHVLTHDFSPLVLSLFLVAAHLPAGSRPALRYLLGGALVLLWAPPFFFVLLAKHSAYLVLPLLMAFVFGVFRLARESSLAFEMASAPKSVQVSPELGGAMERIGP